MTDDKVLKDAQYRKGLSIAFFNATNAAIELTKGYKYPDEEAQKKAIVEIRNWLLDEHKQYYTNVIQNVGANFKAGEAIKKLQAAKTYDELGTVWRLLSEDERRDGEIISAAKAMKAKFGAPTEKVATTAPKVAAPAKPAAAKVVKKSNEKA